MEFDFSQKKFVDGLRELINGYSMENASDTPDYILTEYLIACLDAYNKAVRKRDNWFGITPGTDHLEKMRQVAQWLKNNAKDPEKNPQ